MKNENDEKFDNQNMILDLKKVSFKLDQINKISKQRSGN